MIALLELVIFLIFAPFFLFGFVLGRLGDIISKAFHPATLLTGVWALIVGLRLAPHAVPDDLPFETIIQVLARSDVFGFTTPTFLIGVGCTLIVIAAAIRLVQVLNIRRPQP